MIVNAIFGLIFSIFFVYNYFDHLLDVQTVIEIKDHAPDFFDRYTNIMLSFDFMRERIINNGSLESFVFQSPILREGIDIDDYFKERSLETERNIAKLKLSAPNII